MRSIEDQGKQQYEDFLEKHITERSEDFYDTISRTNLPLFRSNQRKAPSKSQTKIAIMKSDVQLFSRMYIASQARDGDLDAFV